MYFNQSMFFLEIVYNHFVIVIILCNYFIIILRYVIMQKYGIRVKMFEFDPYFSLILDGNADKEEPENMRSLTTIFY